MGQQVLTGISPLQVSQCRELPDYFNVKNSDVIALLGENTTLEEQMKVCNKISFWFAHFVIQCLISMDKFSFDHLAGTGNVNIGPMLNLYGCVSVSYFFIQT